MKTYPDILKVVKQYVPMGLMVLVILFGLSFKSNAQSTSLGNDIDKINNAMVVQVAGHDFDILIPKVSKEEFASIKDAKFNQMVYVVNETAGYYFYMGTNWEKQNVKQVFELINMNMAIQQPNAESLILIADGSNSQTLLDYNDHVQHIYQDFVFDQRDNTMAINLERK
ncbi:hypothetical protein SAMN05661096_02477 [Marivirga sericea]|uniref:Uncharacterized protein n=1 Tax=Marivirga sericea TaxID=1028 RepID=A0A1X7K9X3_9BACT|nr:hypothetical protein [Marivirga sericea]SMG37767.1 hypothetical protein SAMN05661096_02477 [Marivirga sericea]